MSHALKIIGSGVYLPKRIVTDRELDDKIGVSHGTTYRAAGVKQRHYVSAEETQSFMGAHAVMAALEDAHLRYEDLDLIICASGGHEQPIPCSAALIQRALGKMDSGTPCFDINATCLSFVTALDLASLMITTRRYRSIMIVSSEIASVGLN
ncbi:MAG: beta-ketoacyl-ACP synthase III, partial [Proteobacteria bacterium]